MILIERQTKMKTLIGMIRCGLKHVTEYFHQTPERNQTKKHSVMLSAHTLGTWRAVIGAHWCSLIEC